MAEIDSYPPSSLQSASGGLEIRQVGMDRLAVIEAMNRLIFDEDRVINTFQRDDLIILVASWNGEPAGFKIGYRRTDATYYSAKGGVLPAFRRRGIARAMLHRLMELARWRGYSRFTFDTFPNKHPGMAVLGFNEGFRLARAGYNAEYGDYRLRLEREL